MPTPILLPNENVPFTIVAQTPNFIVVDKPAGVVTAPGIGHDRNSLMNGLFTKFAEPLSELKKERDFGLLHRLDRDTSGLILVALSPESYDALRQTFESHAIEKTYLVGVAGRPHLGESHLQKAPEKRPENRFDKNSRHAIPQKAQQKQQVGNQIVKSGRIDRPIRECFEQGQKRARITPGPGLRQARTEFRVLSMAQNPQACLLACKIVTGRLHQIRVHMSSVGCPVLGDHIYGRPHPADKAFQPKPKRLFLHAYSLSFTDPLTGEKHHFKSPLPPELQAYAELVGHKGPISLG